MSDAEGPRPGHDEEPTTPRGGPAPGPRGQDDAGDPVTGSTEPDPAAQDTGLPPAGRDPMAGEAPSS
jgi:hypothetical protein